VGLGGDLASLEEVLQVAAFGEGHR
jgi:hypothetical protein